MKSERESGLARLRNSVGFRKPAEKLLTIVSSLQASVVPFRNLIVGWIQAVWHPWCFIRFPLISGKGRASSTGGYLHMLIRQWAQQQYALIAKWQDGRREVFALAHVVLLWSSRKSSITSFLVFSFT